MAPPKTIPLTQGKAVLVDEVDFERVSAHKWWPDGKGYARGRVDGVQLLMHRFILSAQKSEQVDHVNGDGLDNRRSNLRICSARENSRNRKLLSRANRTGYKGVSWDRKLEKYEAQIKLNNRSIHLGYYADPTDAARAYDVAARQLFGEFARTNFDEQI